MARNIELKARDSDPARSLQVSLALGATDEGWLQQLDTYFNVRLGRLKLREQDGSAELIQYVRTDEAIERASNYRLISIDDPDVFKEALAAALGILVAVEKSRHLLLWRNVRIHLDQVPGLGSFIEPRGRSRLRLGPEWRVREYRRAATGTRHHRRSNPRQRLQRRTPARGQGMMSERTMSGDSPGRMTRGDTDHNVALFDLDGVLVDSRVPFARAVNASLTAQGLIPRREDELHQYLGPPLHQTFRALVGEESLVQPCVDAYRARYRESAASETTVFSGIRELLEKLSDKVPLLIATSKPRALAEPAR